MDEALDLDEFLAGAGIDHAVLTLRPDYRVLLLAVDGIEPGDSDAASEGLLRRAEKQAAELVRDTPVDQLPHIAAWREAYRSFDAPSPGGPATASRR